MIFMFWYFSIRRKNISNIKLFYFMEWLHFKLFQYFNIKIKIATLRLLIWSWSGSRTVMAPRYLYPSPYRTVKSRNIVCIRNFYQFSAWSTIRKVKTSNKIRFVLLPIFTMKYINVILRNLPIIVDEWKC